ncbi:nucleotidyltransferase family protein [Pseudomonas sp. RIT-PI-S]|uniref:nucleotidyltransferase family protein n=1 Tax=Pseudomonas sp. RIT-PI-S TaxID=3035295 RepID=UPI0021D86343|nr:nucleotidyltransferase family protein [Pseudomonas sp. RIT-PI-S]
MSDLCAVVLAAGYGRRFAEQAGVGANKLLATCAGLDGSRRAVLEHGLLTFRDWPGERLLVLRRGCVGQAQLTELAARHGFDSLLVGSDGMGDSLSAAVRARASARGWLVALGDMPWVRNDTPLRVAGGMSGDRACVPVYQGQRGHPVGFGAAFGPALAALRGDQGGRRLLQEGRVNLLEVDDPGVLRDVDVPGDLI